MEEDWDMDMEDDMMDGDWDKDMDWEEWEKDMDHHGEHEMHHDDGMMDSWGAMMNASSIFVGAAVALSATLAF